MANRTISMSDQLYDYLLLSSLREPDILRRLRVETAPYPHSMMQTAPEQGQFMALLLQIIGAVNTIELGVYTGYSSLWTAMALPTQGRIIACDINEEWTSMARRYWQEAGVAEKVDLRLAPAIETLDALLEAGKHGTFDFVFIDADKENYDPYYERSLELLRPGGLIAVDNVLWSGRVADPQARDDATLAIRAFNLKLRDDDRIKLSLVPIADGLTLALKQG